MDDETIDDSTTSDASATTNASTTENASSTTLTDEHHDWASNFCGIDTRTQAETGSDSSSASAGGNGGDSSGGGLLGALSSAASAVSDAASSAINTAKNVVSDAASGAVSTASQVAGNVDNTVGDAVSGAVSTAARVGGDLASGNVGQAIGDAASGAVSTAGQVASDVGQVTGQAAVAASEASSGLWGALKDAASGALNTVENVAGDVGHTVEDATSGIVNTVENVAGSVGGALSSAGGAINKSMHQADAASASLESMVDSGVNSLIGTGADLAKKAISAAPIPQDLKNVGTTYVNFEKGVAEGVYTGVKDLASTAKSAVDMIDGTTLAKGAMKLADAAVNEDARKDLEKEVTDDVNQGIGIAKFAGEVLINPSGVGEAIGKHIRDEYDKAAAKGEGDEFIGKGVGGAAVIAATFVVGGEGAEAGKAADALKVAEEAKAAADAAKAAEEAKAAADAAKAAEDAKAAADAAKAAEDAKAAADAAKAAEDAAEDSLKALEKGGGHVVEKHVGKSTADLIERLAKEPKIPRASTFNSAAEAQRAVDAALQANSDRVAEWVSKGAKGKLLPPLEAPFVGGSIVDRGATAAYAGKNVRVILKGVGDGTWFVLTGFPIP
jgi:trimeric autotransporter adhesin